MGLCENCGKKLEKLEECPYCKKGFCPNCYGNHMSWEKQHQDWSLLQTSPAGGGTSHLGLSDIKSYGPVYQSDQDRRRYRKLRRRVR